MYLLRSLFTLQLTMRITFSVRNMSTKGNEMRTTSQRGFKCLEPLICTQYSTAQIYSFAAIGTCLNNFKATNILGNASIYGSLLVYIQQIRYCYHVVSYAILPLYLYTYYGNNLRNLFALHTQFSKSFANAIYVTTMKPPYDNTYSTQQT